MPLLTFEQPTKNDTLSARRTWHHVPGRGDVVDLGDPSEAPSDGAQQILGEVDRIFWASDGSVRVILKARDG
ncbi:MAG TPA: hypothetical protein VH560_15625 [Polyangia bacterium]|jgi:hypothetical protein|nr:hypothetical protein [Polyangia bacterium]